jgi:tetratricopeptide (TPR) repeat protein
MQYFPIKEMPKGKKIKAAVTVISIAIIIHLLGYINERHFDFGYELQSGVAAYRSGKFDKAIEHFNKAVELDAGNPKGYLFLGISKAGKLEHDNAISDLTKAIAMDKTYADAYYIRAFCHYEKNDLQSAVADASQAIAYIEYQPEQFKAYEAFYLRALARYGLNDLKGAIEDFSSSIKKNNQFSEAYLFRGKAYAALGKADSAIGDYEMVLRIDPENENGEKLIQFIQANSAKN